jgi:hypothetical protein
VSAPTPRFGRLAARAERILARVRANVDDYAAGRIDYAEFNHRAVAAWSPCRPNTRLMLLVCALQRGDVVDFAALRDGAIGPRTPWRRRAAVLARYSAARSQS